MEVSPSSQASSNIESPTKIASKKNRRCQLAKLFVIAFVSKVTVALIIIDVIGTAKSFQKKNELNYKIQESIVTASAIHNLQEERGMTAVQFSYKHLNFKNQSLIALNGIREKVNRSIALLQKRVDANLKIFVENKSLQNILENFRSKIDEGRATVVEILLQYRKLIRKLIARMLKHSESENLEDYANLFYAHKMVALSKEEAGMERAVGAIKLTHGKNFTSDDTTWYNEKRVLAESYLKTAFLFADELKDIYTTVFANNFEAMKKIEERRKILSGEWNDNWSDGTGYEWSHLMTIYSEMMLQLQTRLSDMIIEKVDEKIHQYTNLLITRSLLLCFTLIVVPSIVVSLAKVQKRFYEYSLSLFNRVGIEQARTDFLMQENARYCDNLAQNWKRFSISSNDIRKASGSNASQNDINNEICCTSSK